MRCLLFVAWVYWRCTLQANGYDSETTEFTGGLECSLFTRGEIMATPSIETPLRTRFVRRGLLAFVSLVAFFVIYLASIGPLAFRESRKVGTASMWWCLHETVYHPIFRCWERGPRWVSWSFKWYVGLFEVNATGLRLNRVFAAESNSYWRRCYFFTQAVERRAVGWPGYKAGAPIRRRECIQINCEIGPLL